MRRRHPLIPAVAALPVALIVAACGGTAPSHTATVTAPTGLVAYAHCMRTHGVPSFPDPTPVGGIPKDEIPTNNPHVPAASGECQHLAPAGLGPQQATEPTHTRVQDGLSFARCMRTRGFAKFPDPTRQGQLTPAMVTAAGVDLHQPSLLRAGLACVPASHGLLTRAAIERAVRGAS